MMRIYVNCIMGRVRPKYIRGVKSVCRLNDTDGFHVTCNWSLVIMHVVLEGIVPWTGLCKGSIPLGKLICNKLPTFNCFVGYLLKFLCLCDVIFDVSKNREMEFSNEDVINAVQNEAVLWDATINASEKQKELTWNCIADLLLDILLTSRQSRHQCVECPVFISLVNVFANPHFVFALSFFSICHGISYYTCCTQTYKYDRRTRNHYFIFRHLKHNLGQLGHRIVHLCN